MATAELAQPGASNPSAPQSFYRRHRVLFWIACAVAAAILVIGALLAWKWPFRDSAVLPQLEDSFGSHITLSRYERIYFPNPGFIATGLTLRRISAPQQPPIATIQRMQVEAHWIDLFTFQHRLHLVRMDGVHLVLPHPGSPAAQEDFPGNSSFSGPDTPIQTLDIRNSLLEVLRADAGRYSFPVYALHIENLRKGAPMTYAADLDVPVPEGRIHASGRFGPLSSKEAGATPVSGEFTFTNIRLQSVGDLRGTMSSLGRFQGHLDAIEAQGTSNTPDFAVSDGHPTPVDGEVRCTVNGINGDVVFHEIQVRSGDTTVRATGATKGHHKVTDLDIRVDHGRAQDLLRPFLHRPVPITGPATLQAHAHLLPEGQGTHFLQRLQLVGSFSVPAEKMTDPKLEMSISDFSDRARDRDIPKDKVVPDALASLAGPADVRNGVVSSQHLVFRLQGVEADLHGTFNLHSSAVHLTGNLRMQSDISHTTSGFKAILLKPLAPFFHHKHAGAVVPIAITGTPGHYHIDQNLGHNK